MSPVEVVGTDEFSDWYWNEISEAERKAVAQVVGYLELLGVTLPHPHSSALEGTKYPLRELRPSQGASPLRIVYAFDPLRQAVLLIGGDKSGMSSSQFYRRLIETSERIWEGYQREQAQQKKE
jgi:hypothetical protein